MDHITVHLFIIKRRRGRIKLEDHKQSLRKRHRYESTGVGMQCKDLCVMFDTTRESSQLNNQLDRITGSTDFSHCCH